MLCVIFDYILFIENEIHTVLSQRGVGVAQCDSDLCTGLMTQKLQVQVLAGVLGFEPATF